MLSQLNHQAVRWILVLNLGAASLPLQAQEASTEQSAPAAKQKKPRQGTGIYILGEACPVIGNTKSRIYHVPGDPHYRMMLEQNKSSKQENRACFATKSDAENAGYRHSKAKEALERQRQKKKLR